MNAITVCPVCGGETFSSNVVLWDELISDWQISPIEVAYINHQQGYCCMSCGNNLRSMALANGILRAYKFHGSLSEFVNSDIANNLRVLEINEAGGLSPVLARFKNHCLVHFPEQDMTSLNLHSGIFDLVLHSDTLEHILYPATGLAECYRVLADNGRCIFTVPIIVGRMSRSRTGLKNSYHGNAEQQIDGYVVRTEFGADVWCFAAEAGFREINIHCFSYPSGLAIEASR